MRRLKIALVVIDVIRLIHRRQSAAQWVELTASTADDFSAAQLLASLLKVCELVVKVINMGNFCVKPLHRHLVQRKIEAIFINNGTL